MGRGRQKAKQTKVARQLKYFSPETDYEALARELHSSSGSDDDRTDGFGDDLADEDDTDEMSDAANNGARGHDDDWVSQEDTRR